MHTEQAEYNTTTTARTDAAHTELEAHAPEADYREAEESFAELLKADCLDKHIRRRPVAARLFERGLEEALAVAYTVGANRVESNSRAVNAELAHLFLQRVLYCINRLKFFWYDDLSNYDNERSSYLRKIRDLIEGTWQEWELALLDVEALRGEDVREALLRRAARDVSPAPSASGLYFRDEISEAGYRRLLAIA